MTDVTPPPAAPPSPIYVERLIVRDFRGIDSLELDLEPERTVLVGRNNSGKTRVLRALALALGGVRPESDDLTVGLDGPATIDAFVAPRTPPG